MLVFDVTPVNAIFPLLIVPNKTFLYVDIVCDIGIVDFDAKAAIGALDRREHVAEVELGDEAAGPRLLLTLLRRSQFRWIAVNGPFLKIL